MVKRMALLAVLVVIVASAAAVTSRRAQAPPVSNGFTTTSGYHIERVESSDGTCVVIVSKGEVFSSSQCS